MATYASLKYDFGTQLTGEIPIGIWNLDNLIYLYDNIEEQYKEKSNYY